VKKWINRDIYDIPTVQKGVNTEDGQGLSDDVYQEGECVGLLWSLLIKQMLKLPLDYVKMMRQ
jgi:hypothetical protein